MRAARGLLCVASVAVLLGSLVGCTEQPDSSVTPSTSATASPTAEPVALPRVATARGGVAGWTLASPTTLAFVGPAVGDAADGAVSLALDAPAVAQPVTGASASISVSPKEKLSYSFSVRALHKLPESVAAHVVIAGESVELPELSAEWTRVEGDVTAADGATSATVEIVVDGALTGLAFDALTLVGSDGANRVPNPSFEEVDAPWGVANSSLVMGTDTAAVALSMPSGAATWSLQHNDQTVISGSAPAGPPLTAVSLAGAGQGYYTFSATDGAGRTVSTPIALIERAEGHSEPDSRFGVGLHVEDEWYADAASLAGSLNLGSARNDILWHLNERAPGVYDWDPRYADGFDRLHAQGIHLLGIVNYGNALYGSELTPDTPEAIAAYGRYAAAIAQRFDLVGLEVFNEFNHERFNSTGCGTDPSCYIPLLQAVHDNVRAVDPELPIVAGSTANYDAAWFDGLWRDGGLAFADAVSYHPYEILSDPSALAGVIGASRDSMNTLGGGEKPIWITELGATSYPASLTIEQQADFLLKAATTAVGSGAEKFFWYDLINDSADPNSHEGNFGLFYRPIDGVAALPPKPSAFAYALLIDQLTGRDAVGQKALGDGVVAYEFGSGKESVIVAWAKDQDAAMEIPATATVEVVSADGTTVTIEPVDGVATVTATTAGVFIRGHAADGT